MDLKDIDTLNTPDIAARILAGALLAADFCAVRDLKNPKSKFRLAMDRRAPKLIAHELPRILLDVAVLGEAEREEYAGILESVRQKYGEQIAASPFEPPREIVQELAENALAKGAYASASDALEYLGTRNQRVGELVASALRDLKSKPADAAEGPHGGVRAAARSVWLAVKIKNPLEPLFQKRAIDFHFSSPETRERFYQFLVGGSDRDALDFSIGYLLGDREIFESVRAAFSDTSERKSFLRELAQVLSGGAEALSEFVSRYRASVDLLRAGSDRKPDPERVGRVQAALAGSEVYEDDGAGLLRHLATTHPVSALVCRMIAVPRKGPHLIPIVFEGNTALDVLGLGD